MSIRLTDCVFDLDTFAISMFCVKETKINDYLQFVHQLKMIVSYFSLVIIIYFPVGLLLNGDYLVYLTSFV